MWKAETSKINSYQEEQNRVEKYFMALGQDYFFPLSFISLEF
jgi:hypothetical protein